MARISTYQHDAMPHAEDNVLGTNQSPGHANETVLFSLSAIQELFRNGTVFEQDYNFGTDLDNLPDPIPADFDPSQFPSLNADPAVTVNHNLGTDNLIFGVFVLENVNGTDRYVDINRLSDANSAIRDNTTIYQIDNNNLFVGFPQVGARIQARILISG